MIITGIQMDSLPRETPSKYFETYFCFSLSYFGFWIFFALHFTFYIRLYNIKIWLQFNHWEQHPHVVVLGSTAWGTFMITFLIFGFLFKFLLSHVNWMSTLNLSGSIFSGTIFIGTNLREKLLGKTLSIETCERNF